MDSEKIAKLIAEGFLTKDPSLIRHAYSKPDGEKVYLARDIGIWLGTKHGIIPGTNTMEDALRLLHRSSVATAVIRTAVVFTQ